MYVIVDVSLVRGFVNHDSGLDWEVWLLWVLLLLGVHMLSVVIAFSVTGGRPVKGSEATVLMGFVPVTGPELHIWQTYSGWLSRTSLSRPN